MVLFLIFIYSFSSLLSRLVLSCLVLSVLTCLVLTCLVFLFLLLLPCHSLSLSSFSFFISTLLFSPMCLSLPHLLSSLIIFSAIFSFLFKLIQRGRYCCQGWISSSLLSFYANCMSWYGREDHVTEGATPLQYDVLYCDLI